MPWPWTVNVAGTGRWFGSLEAALAHIAQAQADGHTSFDIGCFQLNHRWHGARFASVEAMFDPSGNARYAAQFLKALFAEFGTWDAAIGAYHSRTTGLADRYRARVHRIMADLPDLREPVQSSRTAARLRKTDGARAPLFAATSAVTASGTGSLRGSLVPQRDIAATGFVLLAKGALQ